MLIHELLVLSVEPSEKDETWCVVISNIDADSKSSQRCENEITARIYAEHIFFSNLQRMKIEALQKYKPGVLDNEAQARTAKN